MLAFAFASGGGFADSPFVGGAQDRPRRSLAGSAAHSRTFRCARSLLAVRLRLDAPWTPILGSGMSG